MLCREYEVMDRISRSMPNEFDSEYFSEFSNKEKHKGLITSPQYLLDACTKYHYSIRDYLCKEMKKRSAERLSWDASYKEAKRLTRYKEVPIFKALITATNELGEVRLQFHAVTDSHDQMRSAIQAYKNTCNSHGHKLPTHVFTDNPHRDKGFFCEMFDSLVDYSSMSASNACDNICDSIENDVLPTVNLKEDQVTLVSSNQDINTFCNALRDQLSEEEPTNKASGLDCEWDAHCNYSGDIIGT